MSYTLTRHYLCIS